MIVFVTGLPILPPFKCNECHFQSKTHLALIKHVGEKHKLLQKLLEDQGLATSRHPKSRSSNISQDHFHGDIYNYDESSMDSTSFVKPWETSNNFSNNSRKSEQHWEPLPDYNSAVKFQQQQELTEPGSLKRAKPNQNELKITKKTPGPIECPICQTSFLTSPNFLRHLTDNHFYDQLCSDLTNIKPFSCPLCNFEGKDRKMLVHHYGISHKVVLKLMNDWSEDNHFEVSGCR